MALRDQPYIPLFVQDFLTDEKLIECSAQATGVYIRLICIMHKSEPYGKILLRQKDKQTGQQILDFATKLAKNLPYSQDVVFASLQELVTEDVMQIEGDFLCQKRMIRDNDISEKRSKSGIKGGKATAEKNKTFALANSQANTEYEIEYIIDRIKEISNNENGYDEKLFVMLILKMIEIFKRSNPKYPVDKELDYSACLQIAYNIAEYKKWGKFDVVNGKMSDCLNSWEKIVEFVKKDSWLVTRSLSDLSSSKEWQRIIQKMNNRQKPKEENNSGSPSLNILPHEL